MNTKFLLQTLNQLASFYDLPLVIQKLEQTGDRFEVILTIEQARFARTQRPYILLWNYHTWLHHCVQVREELDDYDYCAKNMLR